VSFDRDQFLETITKRAGEHTSSLMPLLRQAQSVAPVMERLVTNTDWDKYLQYLQSYINQAERAKANAQRKLGDPSVWEASLLTKLKSDILIADAMIEAWTMSMELPKALIAGADEAGKIIARFQPEEES
jgi:hypothetical protein